MRRRSRELAARGVRLAPALAAVSIWVYIPYRYLVRPPEAGGFLGTAYAFLFPLAAVLALGAWVVAARPGHLARLEGDGGAEVARWVVGSYGAAWLVMGVACVPTLSHLAVVSPVKGLLSTFHMTAQHVFLGLLAVTAAWRPAAVRSMLTGLPAGGREAEVPMEETAS